MRAEGRKEKGFSSEIFPTCRLGASCDLCSFARSLARSLDHLNCAEIIFFLFFSLLPLLLLLILLHNSSLSSLVAEGSFIKLDFLHIIKIITTSSDAVFFCFIDSVFEE